MLGAIIIVYYKDQINKYNFLVSAESNWYIDVNKDIGQFEIFDGNKSMDEA